MSAARISIVEPTPVSDAGHCAAIFGSLHRAAPALSYRLWIDRRADAPSVAAAGVLFERHFHRPRCAMWPGRHGRTR